MRLVRTRGGRPVTSMTSMTSSFGPADAVGRVPVQVLQALADGESVIIAGRLVAQRSARTMALPSWIPTADRAAERSAWAVGRAAACATRG